MTKRASDNWRQWATKALDGKLRPCPNCDGIDVDFTAIISPPLARKITPSVSTGSGIPAKNLLVVTCSGCSFVRLFDADALPRVTL